MDWTPIADNLRPLDPREFVVGRAIPGDVLDRQGRVVMPRGTRFCAELASVIEEHSSTGLFVGPEWPEPRLNETTRFSTMDADELLHALRRQGAARSGPSRLRGHQRHAWTAKLRIVAVIRTEAVVSNRRLEVDSCDLSRSGYAFMSPLYLYEGTVVYAAFEMLPGRPIMKGIVRNCRLCSGRLHRVGVEFTALDEGEMPPL